MSGRTPRIRTSGTGRATSRRISFPSRRPLPHTALQALPVQPAAAQAPLQPPLAPVLWAQKPPGGLTWAAPPIAPSRKLAATSGAA